MYLSEDTKPRGRPSPMMFVSLGIGLVVAVALIVAVSVATGGNVTSPSTSALVGKEVASFSGRDLAGQSITAPWRSGHPTLLVFLASWCAPCRNELPDLSTYLNSHGLGSVRVVGVNYLDNPVSARRLLRATHFRFPVLPDSGAITQGEFFLSGLPDTVVVSSTGHVLAVHNGPTSIALLQSELALAR